MVCNFSKKHVLKIDWKRVDIVKPPTVKTIPDILTPAEVEQLIGATRKLRYRVFLLTTYSMGLRLEEALSLQVGDIDAGRKYNGPQNLNQLLSYKSSGKSRFKLIPEKEVHEKKLQWKIQNQSSH
jgi:integrase